MKQLHHQTSKSLESSGNADRWADLDEDTLGGGNVDLQLSGLVDGGIKEGKKTLSRHSSVSRQVNVGASAFVLT